VQPTAGKKTKTPDKRNFAKIFTSYSSFVLVLKGILAAVPPETLRKGFPFGIERLNPV
jgi:hypothetical protein